MVIWSWQWSLHSFTTTAGTVRSKLWELSQRVLALKVDGATNSAISSKCVVCGKELRHYQGGVTRLFGEVMSISMTRACKDDTAQTVLWTNERSDNRWAKRNCVSWPEHKKRWSSGNPQTRYCVNFRWEVRSLHFFRSFAFDVESLLPGTHETHLLFMPDQLTMYFWRK